MQCALYYIVVFVIVMITSIIIIAIIVYIYIYILSTINVVGIIIIIMITTIVFIVIIVVLGKLGKPIETQFNFDGLQTASTFRLALACCFFSKTWNLEATKAHGSSLSRDLPWGQSDQGGS